MRSHKPASSPNSSASLPNSISESPPLISCLCKLMFATEPSDVIRAPFFNRQITWAAAFAAAGVGLKSEAENLKNLCRRQIHEVASAITDDRLRTTFIRSEAVRIIG